MSVALSLAWLEGAEAAGLSLGSAVGPVLIAPLFYFLRAHGETEGLTLSTFKARLLEAHEAQLILLERCRRKKGVNPLVLAGSTTRRGVKTYHTVCRFRRMSLGTALESVLLLLSPKAFTAVEDYAYRVRDDEQKCEGRPRLITLELKEFAKRVQAVVNEEADDVLVAELFCELNERGEMTGLSFEAFKERLRTAHREGLIVLRAWEAKDGVNREIVDASAVEREGTTLHLVKRTAAPLPIPWGKPAPPLQRAWVFERVTA